ncbi:MAG: hypothetical protein HOW73_30525 [Polyangiaceae bacterium]|nr:hypothetical protein [Polyangiaceae bacterium]
MNKLVPHGLFLLALTACGTTATSDERRARDARNTDSAHRAASEGIGRSVEAQDGTIAIAASGLCATLDDGRVVCWDKWKAPTIVPKAQGALVLSTFGGEVAARMPTMLYAIGKDKDLGHYLDVAQPLDQRFYCRREMDRRIACKGAGTDWMELKLDRPAIAMAALDGELYALQDDGRLRLWTCAGTPCTLAEQAPSLPSKEIRSLHAGQGVVCVIDKAKRPSCGRLAKQEGPPLAACIQTATNVVDVSGGPKHACAIHVDGSVTCCGQNDAGQLGSFAVTKPDQLVRVEGIGPATDIEVGDITCARDQRGLSCWGNPLPFGRDEPDFHAADLPVERADRVVAGSGVTCTLTGKTVRCFGRLRGTFDLPKDVKDLAVAGTEACGVAADGTITCHAFGDLRSSLPENLPAASRITAGESSFCVSGKPSVCWGQDDLRDIHKNGMFKTDGEVLGIDAGSESGCWVAKNGRVTCWGGANRGKWGLAGSNDKKSPFGTVPALRAKTISVGGRLACALDNDDKVWCWGHEVPEKSDLLERAKVDGAVDVVAGSDAACVRKKDGKVACFGPALGFKQKGLAFADLPALEGAVELAMGASHVCGRLPSGKVKCWGKDTQGELGGVSSVRKVHLP